MWPTASRLRSSPWKRSAPLAVEGLALVDENSLRLLVASLVPAAQDVTLVGLPDGTALLRRLNESTAEAALFDPEGFRSAAERVAQAGSRLELGLAPFEVVHVDLARA